MSNEVTVLNLTGRPCVILQGARVCAVCSTEMSDRSYTVCPECGSSTEVLDIDGPGYPPSNLQSPTVHYQCEVTGVLNSHKVYTRIPTDVSGLPPVQPNTIVLVTAEVAEACKYLHTDRHDLYTPYNPVWTQRGQVMHYEGLKKV